MVTKPLASLFWTFALFSIAIAADQFKFTGHLARFVPNCASGCLVSFLNDNFAETSCDTTTSLECLCAETGTSGFTIGEGAVQCIEAEQSIGSCAAGEIDNTAYFMCSGQPSAALSTHTAIEAIFIVPATGGGVKLVSPQTSSSSSTRSSLATTSSTPTSACRTTHITTLATSTREAASSNEAGSASNLTPTDVSSSQFTPTPGPAQAEPTDDESGGLGTAQLAGLSVGVAAVAGILIAAFVLARRRRKRQLSGSDNRSTSITNRDSWGFNPKEAQDNVFHISPPIHGKSPLLRPVDYSRKSWRPDAIGLAVSRPTSEQRLVVKSPFHRRTSRLLPPKPDSPPRPMLSLTIPKVSLTSSTPPTLHASEGQGRQRQHQTDSQIQAAQVAQLTAPPPVHANLRESTMTEFEEDGSGHPSLVGRGFSQVWRPPSSNPQSATTYYVADTYGNWVLGNPKSKAQAAELAELEAPTPLTASNSEKTFRLAAVNASLASQVGIGHGAGSPVAPSAPKGPALPTSLGLLPPAHIKSAQDVPPARPVTVWPGTGPEQNAQAQSLPGHQVPPMSFSHPEPPRRRSNSLSQSRSHRKGVSQDGTDRHDSYKSQQSATTISSSSGGFDGDDGTAPEPGSLSPVVESPYSGVGRSPVSYPAIPGRLNRSNLQVHPPPVRPMYASPPGQPSPTLGLMQPAAGAASRVQNRLADVAHGTAIPLAVALAASATTASSAAATAEGRRPAAAGAGRQDIRDRGTDRSATGPPDPSRALGRPRTRPPTARRGDDDGPAPTAPRTHHDRHQYHWHPQQHMQQQRPGLPRPDRSDGSSSCSSFSSLATKRLGSERAAGLALQSDELAAGSRWRRDNRDGEQESSRNNSNNTFSRDEQSLQPPTTPGWHPTLTPTRRGDDLFLDVR
ncbi:uncharacterized protein VDAG_00147 [Verticillium dahliae VdLs.17]|uniref:Extracellular membrane protein CFEM domain-containing protein n=1 Tax=Verticillium dahliae (strain VdLs.17 / ATCC MYA-4575 / FGSC 10137) TaxID=498257 RepID=G2WRG4_VERDV|nr:uncharacterized protein VDAG_00147 [Verticillium dahliae VdLs.17]EGY13465.1 hypothetical protein VDAG_00147 [Verticillium dahliae VdLs.17]